MFDFITKRFKKNTVFKYPKISELPYMQPIVLTTDFQKIELFDWTPSTLEFRLLLDSKVTPERLRELHKSLDEISF